MMYFILGIVCGVGLSMVAVIVGKKTEIWINAPLPEKPAGMAQIIKKENLDDILNG